MDSKKKENITEKITEPKLYKKRWFILFLYVIITPTSTMQWTQYTIIADIVSKYYNVSFEAVNWTNLVALLCYVIFVFPCSYIIDKYGARKSFLVTTFATCVATWIKLYSVSSDKFWVIILGQVVLSIPQACLLNLAPKIAADWFGPNEVSMACSVGIAGLQIGSAIGFFLPPLLVKKETIEEDLYLSAIILASVCTISLILALLFFIDKPPIPPSYAVMKQTPSVKYLHSIKQLLKNRPLMLAMMGSGINLSIFCIFQALLGQMILRFYPNNPEDAGLIGLLMIVTGLFGSVAAGIILDKFHIYRQFSVAVDVLIIFSFIAYSFTLSLHIAFPYVLCSLVGLLILAKWSVTYQIAIETSYPEPEAIVIGIINTIGQTLGIVFTYIYSFIFYESNTFFANIFLCAICIISFLFMVFSKFELKRQSVNNESSKEVIKEVTRC